MNSGRAGSIARDRRRPGLRIPRPGRDQDRGFAAMPGQRARHCATTPSGAVAISKAAAISARV